MSPRISLPGDGLRPINFDWGDFSGLTINSMHLSVWCVCGGYAERSRVPGEPCGPLLCPSCGAVVDSEYGPPAARAL